jgi:hypothetical protein
MFAYVGIIIQINLSRNAFIYSHAPISADSVSMVSVTADYRRGWGYCKIKGKTVHKFQNARQVRTGRTMVKSSSSKLPNT